MKKQRLFGYFSGFLLSLSLFSGSCTKSTTDDSLPASVSNRLTADKELLAFLGYDTSDLIRLDTCYIVEGDICITDRLILDICNERRTRHTYSQWPHTVQQKNRTIRIGIEGTSIDRSIVSDALRYWNEEIKCGLYFLEDTPYDTKIEFTSSTNPAGGVESAEPPTSDGKPGSKINVFYQSSAYFQANATQKKYLIVHALGHTVGFGHTPATLAEYTATPPGSQIRGTIDYDPKSIMVKPASTLKWSGVSKFDKEAFQKFYPYTAPALSMDRTPYDREFVCNKPYTFRAYYTNDPQCPDPEFEFTVSSESTENASWQIKSNGIMQIIFPAQGTYRIKVAVTNATSRPEITEIVEIIIYDDTPTLTITPTEPIEIGKTYRLHVSYNNPNAGTNPVYDYTIKDLLFGNMATITPVDNASCDVIFTQPGEYEVRASLRSDNKIQTPPLSLPVNSKEIVVTYRGFNLDVSHFNAFYYSAAHPDPKFKFTITDSPVGLSYEIKRVGKDNIDISFYKDGGYTLRVEIEGVPEIYTENNYLVLKNVEPPHQM